MIIIVYHGANAKKNPTPVLGYDTTADTDITAINDY